MKQVSKTLKRKNLSEIFVIRWYSPRDKYGNVYQIFEVRFIYRDKKTFKEIETVTRFTPLTWGNNNDYLETLREAFPKTKDARTLSVTQGFLKIPINVTETAQPYRELVKINKLPKTSYNTI